MRKSSPRYEVALRGSRTDEHEEKFRNYGICCTLHRFLGEIRDFGQGKTRFWSDADAFFGLLTATLGLWKRENKVFYCPEKPTASGKMRLPTARNAFSALILPTPYRAVKVLTCVCQICRQSSKAQTMAEDLALARKDIRNPLDGGCLSGVPESNPPATYDPKPQGARVCSCRL